MQKFDSRKMRSLNYLEDFESDASESPFVLYKVSCCENIKAPIVDTSHDLK